MLQGHFVVWGRGKVSCLGFLIGATPLRVKEKKTGKLNRKKGDLEKVSEEQL